MMKVVEFKALLAERDRELGIDEDTYYAGATSAIDQLHNGRPVKLFNGSVVSVVEILTHFNADYNGENVSDDSWYGSSSSAEGQTFVVQVEQFGYMNYFKITGYFDSWDNGHSDVFRATEIVKVDKVPVDKYEWKEVE